VLRNIHGCHRGRKSTRVNKIFQTPKISTIVHVISVLRPVFLLIHDTMDDVRRSSRKTTKVYYGDTITSSYPENSPQNVFEQRIARLNNQSFVSSSFALVDDALVYALFASKRRTTGYRTMIPCRAFGEEEPPITKEQGIMIRSVYKDCVGKQGEGVEESIREACHSMVKALPEVFAMDKLPILRQ
jgi:hypothetical protein